MSAKELTTRATEREKDEGAVKVEMTLPARLRRKGSTKGQPPGQALKPGSPTRIPRITRLMALAIKFQEMVDRGEVRDYADLARLGYVSRARLTQIMNLLLLAPDIQADILTAECKNKIKERVLRRLTQIPEWGPQRLRWHELWIGSKSGGVPNFCRP